MLKIEIIKAIREINDFPVKGIVFKDLTTVFRNSGYLNFMADEIASWYINKGITKVVGIESRGFILGSILAYKLNAGFVPVRKPGKLPAETHTITYELEYGADTIEIHKDAINTSDVVLIHDDVLATGGTAKAALQLINFSNPKKVYLNFITEISLLNGRQKIGKQEEIDSYIKY